MLQGTCGEMMDGESFDIETIIASYVNLFAALFAV